MIYTPSKSSEFFRDDIPRPPARGGGVGSAVPTSINCPIPIRSPYPEVPSSSHRHHHHHDHEKLSSSCNHASTRRRRQQRERNNGKVSRRATYDSSAPKKKIGNSSCGNNNGRRGEDVSAIMLGLMSVEKKSAKADVYRTEQRNPVKLTGYRHMKRRHSNDGCHVELFHHPAERRSSLCSHMSSASSNHHHHHNNSNKDKDSEDDDESKDKVNNNDESKYDDNNDTESLEGGGSSYCGAAGFSMEKRESAKMFVRTRQADLLEANALGISAPALLTRKRKSLVEGVDASDDFDDQDNDSFNNDSVSDAMSMSTSMSVRSTRSGTRRLNDNSQSIRSARSNRSGPSSSMAASRRGGTGNRRVMRSLSFDDSTRDIYQTSTRGGRRHNNMKNTAADFNRGVKKNNSGGGLMNAFANFRNRKFGFS